METERAANKYKQVEFMQQFVGDDFDAVISGVSTYGFWAETVEHKCEGLVSISDLAEFDDFEYRESEYALVGHRTGIRFAMGDEVRVRVASTNLVKRQIDYSVIEVPGLPEKRKPMPKAAARGGKSFDQPQYKKKKDTKRKKK